MKLNFTCRIENSWSVRVDIITCVYVGQSCVYLCITYVYLHRPTFVCVCVSVCAAVLRTNTRNTCFKNISLTGQSDLLNQWLNWWSWVNNDLLLTTNLSYTTLMKTRTRNKVRTKVVDYCYYLWYISVAMELFILSGNYSQTNCLWCFY